MMAAYWKSPYKEPSNFSGRSANTSTGRFEQSLSLTRAKSSILTSGQDIFGWHLPLPKRPGSSQQHQKQSNGNLKGILKTPKGRLSPRLRIRTDQSNNTDSSADQTTNPQRSTKRVSFGPCDDAVDDDSEYSAYNFRGFRAHYITLQRLNHSRKVEESAMQKLNKLISGVSMKSSTQTTAGGKTSSTNTSPLPVVDGKGLLTPRSDSDKSTSTCKHSPDLKCAGCIKKDVETGEVEIKTTEGESQQNGTDDDSKPVFGESSDTKATVDELKGGDVGSKTGTVKVPLPVTLFDDMSPRLNPEKTIGKRRASQTKPKAVSFQNKKFQSKLLPGRYPFNTGALHTRHIGAKKTYSEKTKPNASEKTDVAIIMSCEQADEVPETEHQQPSLESTQTNSQSTETPDGIQRHVPVIKSRGESRERRSMDKTSQILTWLKDVRQKQNFKPRNARFVVVESQPLQ